MKIKNRWCRIAWFLEDQRGGIYKFEPLTPRQGLEEYKRGYARAELDLKREPLGEEESYHEAKRLYEAEDGLWYEDGFVDGLKFAEKMHGIGGGQ